MTNKVLKSQVPASFESDVAAFADELTRWHGHMAKVGVDPEYVACPRPTATPAVEASVHVEDGAARPHYEVIDDTPSSEEQLRARKDELLVFVSRLEQEAAAKVVPIGKRRFFSMRENDVRKTDAERARKFAGDEEESRALVFGEKVKQHAEELIGASPKQAEELRSKHEKDLLTSIGPALEQADVEEHVEKTRPKEDADFLAEQAERTRRLDAVVRHAAVLHHDIEDLTVDSVADWKPTPFPI